MYKILGLLLVAWTFSISTVAQDTCSFTIEGTVTEIDDGSEVPFANIYIKELETGTVTDAGGNYTISGLCQGDYTIVCSHIGCDHAVEKVRLQNSIQLDFALSHHTETLEDVLVIAKPVEKRPIGVVQQLEGIALQQQLANTLAGTLESMPGVSVLSTGATIAKPVINGLHSDRVLVLQNGIRLEGNQWGTEHAPEIDPFSAGNIEVVKGAAGLAYGPDAIGGVILVDPLMLPKTRGVEGSALLSAATNGLGGTAAVRVAANLGSRLPLSGSFQGTLRKAGTLSAADYFLANTAEEQGNFQWQLAFDQTHWNLRAFYSQYNARLGIFSGAHIGNLTDLENAIAAERPLVSSDFMYTIGRPFQKIEHETFKLTGNLIRDHKGRLHFAVSRQFNRRQEFDAHKPGGLNDEDLDPEMEFELTTWNSQLFWEHRIWQHLQGKIGLQGSHQVNTTDRGGLIPDYKALSAGVYIIERWKKYPFPLEFEGALRFDWRQLEADFQNGDAFSRNFQNVSGSFGMLYHLKNKWLFSGNFSSTWRQPNVSELFSDGVHHGVAAVEFGDQSLDPETSFRTSLDIQYEPSSDFRFQLSLYTNFIRDFIYLNPQDRFELTIRGAFPVFAYQHTDANLSGLDFRGRFPLFRNFFGESAISILRARNLTNEDWLPLMPGDRLKLGIGYEMTDNQRGINGQVSTGFEHFLKQTRVPEASDFAPPPAGYSLWYAKASMQIPLKDNSLLLSIKGQNLGNIAYRNYLNRFRYFADDQGRNLILTIQYIF